jgi:hypothetical protein
MRASPKTHKRTQRYRDDQGGEQELRLERWGNPRGRDNQGGGVEEASPRVWWGAVARSGVDGMEGGWHTPPLTDPGHGLDSGAPVYHHRSPFPFTARGA